MLPSFFLKKSTLFPAVIIVLLFFALLSAISASVNWDKYSDDIKSFIGSRLKGDVEIRGKISGSLLSGFIVAEDIMVSDSSGDITRISRMGIVKAKFSSIMFLLGSRSFSSIEVIAPDIDLHQMDFTHSGLKLKITDGSFGSLDFLKGIRVRGFNGSFRNGDNILSWNGSFDIKGFSCQADLSIKFSDDLLTSASGKMSIGSHNFEFSGSDKDGLFSLDLSGSGRNLSSLFETKSSGQGENYVVRSNAVLKDLSYKNIEIYKFSLNASADSFDISVFADRVDSLLKTTVNMGKIKLSETDIPFVDWLTSIVTNLGDWTLDGTLSNVEIKDYLFSKGSIRAAYIKERGILDELELTSEEETLFKTRGFFEHNGIRPKFSGDILYSGKLNSSFTKLFVSNKDKLPIVSIKGDIMITPSVLIINEANCLIDSNQVIGRVRIKKGGGGGFALISIDTDYMDIGESKRFSFNTFNEASRLNKISSDFSIKARIRSLKAYGIDFGDSGVFLEIRDNVLIAKDFFLQSKDFDLAGNMRFIGKESIPYLYLDLKSNKIKFFRRNQIIADGGGVYGSPVWSSNQFNYDFLKSFNARGSFLAKKVYIGDGAVDKMKVTFSLENGDASIPKLSFFLGEGKFDSSAKVAFRQKAFINTSFSAYDILVSDLMPFSPSKGGKISFSGAIESSGNSPIEIVSSLSGTVNAAARGVLIPGIDLNYFADNLLKSKNDTDLKNIAEKASYSGNTLIKSSDMTFKISGGKAFVDGKSFTERVSCLLNANLSLVNGMINGVARVYFIPPGEGATLAADFYSKGLFIHPNRGFDIPQLKSLVFSGINPASPQIK